MSLDNFNDIIIFIYADGKILGNKKRPPYVWKPFCVMIDLYLNNAGLVLRFV